MCEQRSPDILLPHHMLGSHRLYPDRPGPLRGGEGRQGFRRFPPTPTFPPARLAPLSSGPFQRPWQSPVPDVVQLPSPLPGPVSPQILLLPLPCCVAEDSLSVPVSFLLSTLGTVLMIKCTQVKHTQQARDMVVSLGSCVQ